MSKIIRGYWDCKYCEEKGIDGLLDKCPNCGSGKLEDTVYYMKNKREYFSEDEIIKTEVY